MWRREARAMHRRAAVKGVAEEHAVQVETHEAEEVTRKSPQEPPPLPTAHGPAAINSSPPREASWGQQLT
jgi:hypothetical protein